jgi:hypothetical protein
MHKIMKPRMIVLLKSTGCGGLIPGELVVFETPFREGRHFAKKPGEFVPLFCSEKPRRRFLHGDIRGFNTVFSENEGEGWLIDFDFGGKDNQQLCSRGYKFLSLTVCVVHEERVESGTIGTHWDN